MHKFEQKSCLNPYIYVSWEREVKLYKHKFEQKSSLNPYLYVSCDSYYTYLFINDSWV